jgi:hypothetical protein
MANGGVAGKQDQALSHDKEMKLLHNFCYGHHARRFGSRSFLPSNCRKPYPSFASSSNSG